MKVSIVVNVENPENLEGAIKEVTPVVVALSKINVNPRVGSISRYNYNATFQIE
jgi:hypothetical protein